MCRVIMGHLRVTVGHLRVTIGYLRATMGYFRVLKIGHLKVFLPIYLIHVFHQLIKSNHRQ